MTLRLAAISTWDPLFVAAIRRHYTQSRGAPPGKKLALCVLHDEEPVGWRGLGEPAYKLAPRRRLGIDDARPLPHTVGNFIFRLEREVRDYCASDVIRECMRISLSAWELRYGWRPVHVETMVDPAAVASAVPGYSYRRAGFRSLGLTTGRSARRPPGHTHGARVWSKSTPKLVLYWGPLARLPKE
jgi:hypothetical protein